jgi:hypothetical protein
VFPHPGYEDTDDDFLDDYLEVTKLGNHKKYVTNPLDQDSDNDGLTDGKEWETDFVPYFDDDGDDNYDANGDGSPDQNDNGLLVNGIKIDNGADRSHPRKKDTDGDDLPDGWEYEYGRTKLRKFIAWHDKTFVDKKANWVNLVNKHGGFQQGLAPVDFWVINPTGNYNDKHLDPDGDGLDNWEEYELNTDPLGWDSDGDGLPDGWEIDHRIWVWEGGFNGFNLDPSKADSNENDIEDDEDGDGNFNPTEEIWDGRDNDGDGETAKGAADGKDNDADGYIDEPDEVNIINWIDDDGDGFIDEGIDEEWDLNDANEDYDMDGVWYVVAWFDDDHDEDFDEDPLDDDGDGFINEDPADGFDNDGDNLVDEDTGGIEDDNDGDGLIDEDPKRYYHPFTNLEEFKHGEDIDGDGINDISTHPNVKYSKVYQDNAGNDYKVPDGWRMWFIDYQFNVTNPRMYQDNDSLPRGWEELFNGSLVLFPTDYTPQGLLEEPSKYVGKFNPNKVDSDGDGVPDGIENYDGDQWDDPMDDPDQGAIACNNTIEYQKHSDPTNIYSTPQIEFRSAEVTEESIEGDSGSGTSTEFRSFETDSDQDGSTIIDEDMKAELVIEYEKVRMESNQAIIKSSKEDLI